MRAPARADRPVRPHLLAGEQAVIDPDDREPVQGEIYVVKIGSPWEPDGYRLRLVQLWGREYDFAVEDAGGWRRDPDIGWMMHFEAIRHRPNPPTRDEIIADLRSGRMSLCDGPLRTDGMRRYIVGRVIGFVPT